jgi:dephospho-CoA kinase
MLKVGITGGIGSGKSTVCQVFETLGIPVFYADRAAKFLMETDISLKSTIRNLIGEDAYINGTLNREKIATLAFSDPAILTKLNKLVHPVTIQYGKEWMKQQVSYYALKEAAIFFETGSNKDMDLMIGVYAPQPLRISRVQKRENTSLEKIHERISNQMDEEEKMRLCDHVIINDDMQPVIPQVLKLHLLFQSKISSIAQQ